MKYANRRLHPPRPLSSTAQEQLRLDNRPSRQVLRAFMRATTRANINAMYGLEPRRARRGIAHTIARREWRRTHSGANKTK